MVPHCSQCFLVNTCGRSLLCKCARTLETLQEFQHHKNICQNLKSLMQLCITVPKTRSPKQAWGRTQEHSDSVICVQNLPCAQSYGKFSGGRGDPDRQTKAGSPNPKGLLPSRRALQPNLCVLICTWNEFSKSIPALHTLALEDANCFMAAPTNPR